MKSQPFTVHAPYVPNSKPVTVWAYDTDSALRKACTSFPAGAWLVAKRCLSL